MWQFLQGKKTYLLGAALALVTLVYWIDATVSDDPATPQIVETRIPTRTYDLIWGLLGGGTAMTLGSKINRLNDKLPPQ